MTDYTQTAAMQLIHHVKEFEDYFKGATGRVFKLKKPLLKEGNTRVIAKFVTRKKGNIDGISYWPMFRYILDYDPGADEYRVEAEFWDDMKLGKPAASWKSGSTVPLDNVFSPSLIFRNVAQRAKERMDKGLGRDGMKGANQGAQRRADMKRNPPKRTVEVRMPMFRRDRKTGQRVQTYAVYTGTETEVPEWARKKTKQSKAYALRGKRKGGYTLIVFTSGAYSFFSNSKAKPIASGTLSDKYAPEIIVR